MVGSPPQMDTIGAPHSSTAFRHVSTGSMSRMVLSNSRIFPHPSQARLHRCVGSSISTNGYRFFPRRAFLTMYVVKVHCNCQGNLMKQPPPPAALSPTPPNRCNPEEP